MLGNGHISELNNGEPLSPLCNELSLVIGVKRHEITCAESPTQLHCVSSPALNHQCYLICMDETVAALIEIIVGIEKCK